MKQNLYVVGSSNGLVCLLNDTPGDETDLVALLWNPSIRKSIFLPCPGVKFYPSLHPMQYLGFGYDPITDDYKLVRLVYLYDLFDQYSDGKKYFPVSDFQIYTLRTGAWRTITGHSCQIIADQSFSVFLNGSIHWFGHTREHNGDFHNANSASRNVILSFDIGDEDFHKMAVPKSLEEVHRFNMKVAVLDGLLALVPYRDQAFGGFCSVWVMKEYGVAETWTKLFNINFGNVLGFTMNGEVLVTKSGKLRIYDPNSQRTLNPHIHAQPESFYFDTYMESLVLLNVEDGVEESLIPQFESLFYGH